MKFIVSCSFGKDSLAMLLRLIQKKYPIDAVVFYDTGKEFQAIYNLRDKIKNWLESKGIIFVELKPGMTFDYKMFDKPVCKMGTKEVHKYGYSWCGGTCRWGTTDKLHDILKYCKNTFGNEYFNFFQYIGIAVDEGQRIAKEYKMYKSYPLVDWGMTEQNCLDFCYEQGFDWLEKTNSIYDVPDYIDLYRILDRVSCWCCRNKNLKELKNIYFYFTNSYWLQLKNIQSKLKEPMKQSGSIFELEERFKREIELNGGKL